MDFNISQQNTGVEEQKIREKEAQLAAVMDEYGKGPVCLAFSGGVDSSLLLKLACDAARRHGTKVWAVTFDTMLHPACDLENAKKVAEEMDASHIILAVNELEQEELRNNPVNRCYLCKHRLFLRLQEFASQKGCAVILDGTNADDLKEYRPGLAALKELGVKSPLAACGLTKQDVKALAAQYGISTVSRPSAPCMATRLPYGARLDSDLLKRIEAGEEFLRQELFSEGQPGNVRLRVHGDTARLETDAGQFSAVLEKRAQITERLKALGFTYITLDLEGFRSGSMDVNVKTSMPQTHTLPHSGTDFRP